MPSNRRKRSRDTTPARSSVRMTKAGKAKEKVMKTSKQKETALKAAQEAARLQAEMEGKADGHLDLLQDAFEKTEAETAAFVRSVNQIYDDDRGDYYDW